MTTHVRAGIAAVHSALRTPHSALNVVCGTFVLAAVAVATPAAWAAAGDLTDRSAQSRRDLVSAGVTAPKSQPGAGAALARAIAWVERIRVVPKEASEEAASQTPLDAALSAAAEEAASMTQSAGTTSAVSEAILSEIKRLSPDKVADPLKLADILYQGGCLDEAVPFYQRAYDTSADAPAKAWALFQMANCRRQTDAAAALTLYRRVTTEFPKSPWKVTANTECRLIEWRQSLVATPAKSGQTAASATSTAGKATSSATGTAAPKPTAAAPSKPAFAAPSVSAPDESAAAAAPESLTASAAVAPAATKTSAPQPRGPAVMVDGVLPTPTARAAEKEAPAAAEKAAPASPVAEKTTSAEADIPTAPAAASTASAGTDAPAAEPPVEEKTAPTPGSKRGRPVKAAGK